MDIIAHKHSICHNIPNLAWVIVNDFLQEQEIGESMMQQPNGNKHEDIHLSQLTRLRYLSHRRPAKALATSEGSGEPAHPRSLARAFAVCIHEVWK